MTRYRLTIVSKNASANDIIRWVFEHWGYDYWDSNWLFIDGEYQDLLINDRIKNSILKL